MLYKVATLVTALLAGSAAAKAPSWDEWAHGRVVVNNITMHYRYAGHGPPLLLVHGNPQHSVSFLFINCSNWQLMTVFQDHLASSRPIDG